MVVQPPQRFGDHADRANTDYPALAVTEQLGGCNASAAAARQPILH